LTVFSAWKRGGVEACETKKPPAAASHVLCVTLGTNEQRQRETRGRRGEASPEAIISASSSGATSAAAFSSERSVPTITTYDSATRVARVTSARKKENWAAVGARPTRQ